MTDFIDNDMCYRSSIDYRISLKPYELNSVRPNEINSLIISKIKNEIGDKCYKHGYIIKSSINLIQRSIGKINSAHFNGNLVFDVKLDVNVCNPVKGNFLKKCQVIGINKMGILAEKGPITIGLSKVHHNEDKDKFDVIKKGDEIDVEVLHSKYELHDKEIEVLAKLI